MNFLYKFYHYSRISLICAHYGIKDFTIDRNMIVNVNESVNVPYLKIKKLPFQFGEVLGDCLFTNGKLETLKGSPNYIFGSFFLLSKLIKFTKILTKLCWWCLFIYIK